MHDEAANDRFLAQKGEDHEGGHMRRRVFLGLIGISPIWPRMARADARMVKIGVLWHAGSADEEKVYLNILTKAFSDLGYAEGKNIALLNRYPAEQPERFRSLAKELVESNVDVIVATTSPGSVALKQLTNTIPIVFVTEPDPVGSGLVVSLAHPGGNFTGVSTLSTDLSGKRLSIMKDAIPSLSRVALLLDQTFDPTNQRKFNELYSKAAKAMGLELHLFEVSSPDAIDGGFSAIAGDGCNGAVVHGSMLANEAVRVGESAIAHRIPAISAFAEKAPYGLLMTYGPNIAEILRKTASYVDKIVKGAKPADLPVEQPTRLDFVINLKVAKTLGLTIPPTLLAEADEVIE
jgi:putative tryptophan/tyrosine transport system substrate-binding protein